MAQKCYLCERRRARRACPALGHSICAVCCGTKRVVEIACPSDCSYLVSSQSHPPAALQRKRESDLRFLLPLLQGMTERQQHVMLTVQGFLRRDRPDAPAMTDDEVEQAARALAETYETASRGIIYEHSAGFPSAERLGSELKALVETQRAEGLRVGDNDVAQVFRRIETGAREARSSLPGGKKAFLDLLKRVLRNIADQSKSDNNMNSATRESDQPSPGSGLIVPGR